MADSADHPIDFTRIPHPAPASPEARERAIADPGFGKVFTDHMVTIDWDEDRGWHGAALGPRGVALGGQLLRAHVVAIGAAGFQQLVDDLAVAVGAGELRNRLAVVIDPQPPQALEDRGLSVLGGAGAVGVLDPQQELPAGVTGV